MFLIVLFLIVTLLSIYLMIKTGEELWAIGIIVGGVFLLMLCLLYTSPSPRDGLLSRMPSSA